MDFNKLNGIVPAIIQDARSRKGPDAGVYESRKP
jgi:hypothetical protein